MALLGRRDILFLLSSSPNLEASRAIDSYLYNYRRGCSNRDRSEEDVLNHLERTMPI